MPSYNTLSILTSNTNTSNAVSNSNTFTATLPTTDYASLMLYVQQIWSSGGVLADNGIWVPVTAIEAIKVS